jgi:nitronate monooxygenase
MNTWLTKTFNIKYPIILAPMFLVSNEEMLLAASNAGIMGCIPALNWRTPEEFREALLRIKENCSGPFGVNLIVNKSNIHLQKQYEICEEVVPDFIITSLGSPEEVIKRLKPKGTKIICDVIDADYAKKVESLGADAIIAVNSGAGGHAGNIPTSILVPLLKQCTNLPIISAGGIGTGSALLSSLALGACGASIGSPFIACHESKVSNEYKQAIVDYGASDIALSTKISGTPCTVIKTPFVEKVGLTQNFIESTLNKNKKLKKYVKMLTYYKGMKALENAAFSSTYKTIWCAGPSIEFVNEKESIDAIVNKLIAEYKVSLNKFKNEVMDV